MNAVGIDVSKGKSMVAIMRPFGEIVFTPFEIKHTTSDINSLVELINSVDGESRIVMEHTGRYYEVLAHQLSKADLFVSAINPKLIKDFDNDSLRKVKSDKADAVKIARYALDKWQSSLPLPPFRMLPETITANTKRRFAYAKRLCFSYITTPFQYLSNLFHLRTVLCVCYSLRSASTGSFFAACFDGIRPLINVRITLRITSAAAPCTGRTALMS